MVACNDCGAPKLPLFSSLYCPNNCDKEDAPSTESIRIYWNFAAERSAHVLRDLGSGICPNNGDGCWSFYRAPGGSFFEFYTKDIHLESGMCVSIRAGAKILDTDWGE